jgi:hypothetical protein
MKNSILISLMFVVVLGVLIAFTIENKKGEKHEAEIKQEVVDRND